MPESCDRMDVFGQRIHWTETGNGSPVILLHGLGSDSSEWTRVTGVLAAHRRVIWLDQIGFGQSGKPALPYRTGTLCSFLEGFYEKLKLDRATLVAHGYSGAVAVQFAASQPKLVDRLVLVNTGFLLSTENLELLNPVTRSEAHALAKLTQFEFSPLQADQAWADSLVSAAANQSLIEGAKSGKDAVAPLLANITHPTLLIWGRNDALTPVESGERLLAALPNAEMIILERCGHSPHREKPKEFAALVEKFLAGAKIHQRFRKQRHEENIWF